MKIVQLIPDFGVAGAETMCENLIYELDKLGHDVIVISLYDIHSTITNRLENNGINIVYLGKKSGLDLSTFKKLFKIINEIDPDIIHMHRYLMLYMLPVLAKRKYKSFHTVHNLAKKESNKLHRIANRFGYRYFSVVPVALTKKIQESIMNEYDLPEKSVPIIFNGINLDNCIIKNNYYIDDQPTIVHIGRFLKQKNHKRLLYAFSRLLEEKPKCILKLVGDGADKEKIVEIMKELGLESNVKFEGIVSNVYPILHNADIFILSSDYEGMPMTIIEAMGTALPIVSTNVGGISDMITNMKEGILTDCSIDSLSSALKLLINNRKLRERLGKNALIKSEMFSSISMAKYYEEIYRKF